MTDMITHTPGPWKTISLDGHLYINPDRESGEYALICKMTGNHPAKEKNAELIASAPFLKAQLTEAVECLEYIIAWNPDNWSAETARNRAKQIIASVKGKEYVDEMEPPKN